MKIQTQSSTGFIHIFILYCVVLCCTFSLILLNKRIYQGPFLTQTETTKSLGLANTVTEGSMKIKKTDCILFLLVKASALPFNISLTLFVGSTFFYFLVSWDWNLKFDTIFGLWGPVPFLLFLLGSLKFLGCTNWAKQIFAKNYYNLKSLESTFAFVLLFVLGIDKTLVSYL